MDGTKKYGLQIRKKPAAAAAAAAAKPRLPPPAFGFGDDDGDEDDVEKEISRQASKTKELKKVEEQHKKALEEDPSVFDYDGVYDEMKVAAAKPRLQEQAERKSKYIESLMKQARQRKITDELVYEKKLLKERSKEDHLYEGKEKFVTSAYKKHLAERAQWLEEEKLREIREEKDDVTKKSDLSDFYFGLNKNVAFGAPLEEAGKPSKQEVTEPTSSRTEAMESPTSDKEHTDERSERSSLSHFDVATESEVHVGVSTTAREDNNAEQALPDHAAPERYKRSGDALAAARERFLARKRSRVQ